MAAPTLAGALRQLQADLTVTAVVAHHYGQLELRDELVGVRDAIYDVLPAVEREDLRRACAAPRADAA